ncbi:DUF3307 domain-containing protein [Thermophagus sp. OGC60D27]|uniref:DUF3307 domain-containing protein n=1 Tax=Thermophagus sp. OGC60D27 TaxID=3458415 RepID=UPI00403838B2
MTSLILKLLIAHFLGDFVFQPDKWVKEKREKQFQSGFFYLHLVVHAFFLWLVLAFQWYYWPLVLISIASHFIIDGIKLKLEKNINPRLLFMADQFFHLMVIILLVDLYEPFSFNVQWLFTFPVLLLISTFLMLTSVSSVIVKTLMSGWSFSELSPNESLPNAGKYIGMLERLFIFAFIVFHQWQAIGFLIAAKSIFRFSDISRAKDRKLTEYMLIGTLLSFGLATLTSLCYLYVVEI